MKKGLTTNKNFLNFIKMFLTNKGFISHNYITPTYKNKIIADEKQLAKLFNSYYINTFQKSSGTEPRDFDVNFERTNTQSIKDIVNSFKNYPSIIKIKQTVNGYDVPNSKIFLFKTVNELKLKPSERSEYKKGK